MLSRLVESSVRQRLTVYALTLVLVIAGAWSALHLPLDAVPDITSPQVQINTLVPALAPEEIEKQVTFPLENEMGGLPGLKEFRSLSKFGLSQVTMVFEDGVDLFRLRQLVGERIQTSAEQLPPGLTPKMAPIATGLGEIYYYSVDYASGAAHKPQSRTDQLMELKVLHDTLIKPQLRQTPGIAEVNVSGGFERQVVVQPDPMKLRLAGLTFGDVAEKLRQSTRNAGGGSVEIGGEQAVIRSNTRLSSQDEIAHIPLRPGSGAAPLRLGEVATIEIGSNFRTGASTRQGEEALLGAAIMMAGENSRVVSRAVREKLAVIQSKLPPGIEITTLYDRGDLVQATLLTVEKNLAEGAILVVAVLFVFLGNLRAALIVALAIPLSMCFAVTGMAAGGLAGNLMSLGAIDFGLIVDGSVVMAENILRHLSEKQRQWGRPLSVQERIEEVIVSAKEVVRPMFAGVLIITVVYVPILALRGIEGKMFKPMAVVVMLALGGALVLAITLVPALCAHMLGKGSDHAESRLVRATKSIYSPLLRLGLRSKTAVLLPMLLLFGLAAFLGSRLGREFIPHLEEGSFAMHMIRGGSVGLGSSVEMQKRSERILLEWFPEIREIFSRIGTAEIATDPMGPNVADTYIMLHPPEKWRTLNGRRVTKEELGHMMEDLLSRKVPGQSYETTQPIQMRFNEIMAGTRANLVCKIFGDDYETIERLAGEVRNVLLTIPGNGDPPLEGAGRTPMLEIRPSPGALQRHGLHAEDVNQVIETALAGENVGSLVEGNRRIPIVVRASETLRTDPAGYKGLPIASETGALLTLGQVAQSTNVMSVATIARENSQRRIAIMINITGRDTVGFVEEARQAIQRKVSFPAGYFFEFGGQFENYLEAKRRLSILVPAALALIVLVIYLSFGSARQTALICVCLPLAASGGVIALWLRGLPFTISAAVGFIALSGIAVLNGIMLLSYINQLRKEGMELMDAVLTGTLTRLRPKLMTALVASLGFVPMALSTGPGAEVQRPLATVVIGGIVTSTLLTLFVLPVLYEWLEKKNQTLKVPL